MGLFGTVVLTAIVSLVCVAAFALRRSFAARTHDVPSPSFAARLQGIVPQVRRSFSSRSIAAAAQRWRWYLVIGIVVVSGAVYWFARQEPATEYEAAGQAIAIVHDGGTVQSIERDATRVDIDPRKLARLRADEMRYKQGLALLIGIAVVTVAWIGIARFAGAT